jgi:antitoxin PrlF
MPTAAKAIPVQSIRAKVTSKGQITVPLEIRRSLGIKPGDHLLFEQKKSGLSLTRETEENVFEKWRGIGTGFQIPGKDKASLIAYFREMRGHDDLD